RPPLPDLPLTVLYDEIWQHHEGLRQRFEVDRGDGRLAFLRWLVERGFTELKIPAAFTTEARAALERERLRQLEADEPLPEPPVPPPAAATLAPDDERDLVRRQAADLRLLLRSNKALRRELTGLRVRRWRDEETIRGLESDLAEARTALD